MQAGPADEEEFDALPVVPLGDKKLRACLVTGLVKTEDQVRTALPSTDERNLLQVALTSLCTLLARSFIARAMIMYPAYRWLAIEKWSTSAPLQTSTGALLCSSSAASQKGQLTPPRSISPTRSVSQANRDDETPRELGSPVAGHCQLRSRLLRPPRQGYAALRAHCPAGGEWHPVSPTR